MALRIEITLQIKNLLKENPKGLRITDIVKKVRINRNTAGRYLENLLVSGQVEMRRFGMAKIYSLSQRVPLSALLSISSELVLQLDNSLRVIYANEPFLLLVGTDIKNLSGKNIEFTPVALAFEDFFTEFIENLRQGVNGKEWVGEILLKPKGIFFSCHIAPTVFEDGRKGVSVIFEDITEQKQAGKKIEESERQFRLLAENSLDMIARIKPDGRRIYLSPAYKTTLGYEPEELIGKRQDDFIHPEDAHIMESLGSTLTRENSSTTVTFRTKHKNGHYIWIESTVRAIFDDKTRELSEYYTVTRDITNRKKAEIELRESEERYRKLVEISPDGVIIHQQGKIIFINPAALSILGVSQSDEIIGKPVLDLIHPDFRDSVRKNVEKDLIGEVSPMTELHMLRDDGTSIIVEGRGVKTTIGGKPVIQVAIRDITERKRMEEEIRIAEETYRNIFLNSQIGLFRTHIHTGLIIDANDAVARFIGYQDRASLLAEPFNIAERYVDPHDREEMLSLLLAKGQFQNYDARFRKNDGSIVWIRFSAKLVREKGWLEGVSEEITERKRTEIAMHESVERLRLLLDNSEDLIVVQDPDGRYLYFNASARYGVSEDMMIGSTPHDLLDKEAADRIVERVKNVAKTGQSIKEETRLVWKGQTLWFIDNLSPIRNANGTITAVVTVSHNITDRKHSEMVLRESEEKYRTLVTATGDIIWETDDQAHFVFVSPQVESIIGFKPDELIGHTPFEFFKPDAIEPNQKMFRKAIENKDKSIIYLSHWIHKDGHSVYLESHAVPVYRSDGSFSGFIGIDREKML